MTDHYHSCLRCRRYSLCTFNSCVSIPVSLPFDELTGEDVEDGKGSEVLIGQIKPRAECDFCMRDALREAKALPERKCEELLAITEKTIALLQDMVKARERVIEKAKALIREIDENAAERARRDEEARRRREQAG